MLRQALLLHFRSFKRFKGTFFINLVGLSTGVACTMLIYLWVSDELDFDKFHSNSDRLFQAMENQEHADGVMTTEGTPGLLAEALAAEMPEVERATSVVPSTIMPRFVVGNADKKLKAVGQFAGKDYFSIFSFSVLQGDRQKVLADPSAIVISESLARKLYPMHENVVGKTIEWHQPDRAQEAIISGVFRDIRANSSVQFDFVLPYDTYKSFYADEIGWGNYGRQTFLLLNKGTDVGQFNKKIAGFLKAKDPGNRYTICQAVFNRLSTW